MNVNEIRTVKDYIKIKKHLENREILYEDILPGISDELGFRFFSSIYKKETNALIISKEVQISYFLNNYFDTYSNYTTETRIVFYEIARIIYGMDRLDKADKNESKEAEANLWEDYTEQLDQFMIEFDDSVNEKIKLYQHKKISETLESGHTIALAFRLIDTGAVEKDYLTSFCTALDDLIMFVGHTEFYTTEVADWLNEVFGRNVKPVNFELP